MSLLGAGGGVSPLSLKCPCTTDMIFRAAERRLSNGKDLRNVKHSKFAQSTTAQKKSQKVLAIENSSLKSTETPVCRTDNLSREVCFLTRACIHDITEKLASLVGPEDYQAYSYSFT